MLILRRCTNNFVKRVAMTMSGCALTAALLLFSSCDQATLAVALTDSPPDKPITLPDKPITLPDKPITLPEKPSVPSIASVDISFAYDKQASHPLGMTVLTATLSHSGISLTQNNFTYIVTGNGLTGSQSGIYTLNAGSSQQVVTLFVRDMVYDTKVTAVVNELIVGQKQLRGTGEMIHRGQDILVFPLVSEVLEGEVAEVHFRRNPSATARFSIDITGGHIAGKRSVTLFADGRDEQVTRITAANDPDTQDGQITLSLKENALVNNEAEVAIRVVDKDRETIDCPANVRSRCELQRSLDISTALPVYHTSVAESGINHAGDADWFAADLASGVVYEMTAYTKMVETPWQIAVSITDRFTGAKLLYDTAFGGSKKTITLRTHELRNRYWIRVRTISGAVGPYTIVLRQIDQCTHSMRVLIDYHQRVSAKTVRDYHADGICELRIGELQAGTFLPADNSDALDGNAYFVRLYPNTTYRLRIHWKDSNPRIQTQFALYRFTDSSSQARLNDHLVVLGGVVLNADDALARVKKNHGIEYAPPERTGFTHTTSSYISAVLPTLVQLLPSGSSSTAQEYSLIIERISR